MFAALVDWVGALPAAAISRFTNRDVLRVLLVIVPYLLWTADRHADGRRDARTEESRLANEAWQEWISSQIAELAGAVDALATATDVVPSMKPRAHDRFDQPHTRMGGE